MSKKLYILIFAIYNIAISTNNLGDISLELSKRPKNLLTKGISKDVQIDQDTYQALEKLESSNVNFVLFTFTDLLGKIHEITIPIQHVKEALINGLTFDSSSIPGYHSIEASDMVIKPDVKTLRILPWTKGINKTGWFICNTFDDFNTANSYDPRYILQKASQELASLGYEFFVGPEIEFFVLNKHKRSLNPIDYDKYFSAETNLSKQQEHQLIIAALQDLDINIEKFHHEVAPGQYEFSIKYGSALDIADQIVVVKHALKILYSHLKKTVTFMPKPFSDRNGSGMHINYSLWDTEQARNAFYDNSKSHNLSLEANQFIAGNMQHIKELGLLFNPTVNSYKRLVPDFEAPVYICWSEKNRSALFRLPLCNGANSMRMELRGADISANPYLAFAGLIKSGLSGLKNKSELPQPIIENLFKLDPASLKACNISMLSRDLYEAIKFFESSALAKDIMTERGHAILLNLKHKEWNSFKTSVTNWELEQYL